MLKLDPTLDFTAPPDAIAVKLKKIAIRFRYSKHRMNAKGEIGKVLHAIKNVLVDALVPDESLRGQSLKPGDRNMTTGNTEVASLNHMRGYGYEGLDAEDPAFNDYEYLADWHALSGVTGSGYVNRNRQREYFRVKSEEGGAINLTSQDQRKELPSYKEEVERLFTRLSRNPEIADDPGDRFKVDYFFTNGSEANSFALSAIAKKAFDDNTYRDIKDVDFLFIDGMYGGTSGLASAMNPTHWNTGAYRNSKRGIRLDRGIYTEYIDEMKLGVLDDAEFYGRIKRYGYSRNRRDSAGERKAFTADEVIRIERYLYTQGVNSFHELGATYFANLDRDLALLKTKEDAVIARVSELLVRKNSGAATAGESPIGSFIFEPVLGAGLLEADQGRLPSGVKVLRPTFLLRLQKLLKAAHVITISDEILTGAGRTGRMWAYQHYPNFKPDVLTFGKAMQAAGVAVLNGSVPTSSIQTTRFYAPEMLLKTIQVLKSLSPEGADLLRNIHETGPYMLHRLREEARKNGASDGGNRFHEAEAKTLRGIGFLIWSSGTGTGLNRSALAESFFRYMPRFDVTPNLFEYVLEKHREGKIGKQNYNGQKQEDLAR